MLLQSSINGKVEIITEEVQIAPKTALLARFGGNLRGNRKR